MKNYLYILFLLLIISCGEPATNSQLTEGTIHFKIQYFDCPNNGIKQILPQEMSMTFKDNNTISQIDGFMGLYTFAFITNTRSAKNSTLLKIMDKKFLYQIENGTPAFGYDSLPDLRIEKLEETKKILGYTCKKAIIKSSALAEPFAVYYTNEIGIENPNINNPFREIDGVLLEFQVKLNSINMKFIATEISQTRVCEDLFTIPSGYQKVSYDIMSATMNSYLTSPSHK